ncbi:hypothetical protein GALL_481190 [mine drainage metagenome]|uniref:Uncharacterized protein n=1 Tax=mine drainage metagenome TaxID=410659 RepID=A0A1J5PFU8_9ZZZZ
MPTSRVDDHDVVLTCPGDCDAFASDGHRVAGRLPVVLALDPGVRGEHRDTRALADHGQLGDGVRALQVGRDEDRGVPLLAQVQRELAREGRLARALEARQQDDRRWGLRQGQRPVLTTEDRDELVIDDLDDLLGRVQRTGHLRGERALPHAPGELPDHRHRDVGVEEGTPDLADRGVHVGLGQPSLGAEVLEGRRKTVGQGREHRSFLTGGRAVGEPPGYRRALG